MRSAPAWRVEEVEYEVGARLARGRSEVRGRRPPGACAESRIRSSPAWRGLKVEVERRGCVVVPHDPAAPWTSWRRVRRRDGRRVRPRRRDGRRECPRNRVFRPRVMKTGIESSWGGKDS